MAETIVEPMLNWAGIHTFRPAALHRPATVDELRRIAAGAPKLHAIGARHCFNDIADAPGLVSLKAMPDELVIDPEAMTASFNAGMRYHELAVALEAAGYALHNLASLPHVTVAGAVATATHGSGDRLGNLATAVRALELVTSVGDLVRLQRGDPDFPGAVVNLGALGVVSRLTLAIEPTYQVRQQVFEHLPWETLFAEFDAITASADSVSLFTDYGATVNQVWLKTRVRPGEDAAPLESFRGARAAATRLNPVVSFPAEHCTEQLGIPGPWCDRLTHVALSGVTETGDHIQSEYMVPRHHALAAIRALTAMGDEITRRVYTAEIRTVAADDLWLSSAYGTDTVCLHFSWAPDQAAVLDLLPHLEAALAPFEARPHWGKVFLMDGATIAGRFPRIDDFRALAERLDPRGAFRTPYLERSVFG